MTIERPLDFNLIDRDHPMDEATTFKISDFERLPSVLWE